MNADTHSHIQHRFEQKSHHLKRNHLQLNGLAVSPPQSGKFVQVNSHPKSGFQVEEMKQKLNSLLKKTEFVLNRQKSIQSPTLKNGQREKQYFFRPPESERPLSTDSLSPKKENFTWVQKEKDEKEAEFSTKNISKQESESQFNPQSFKAQSSVEVDPNSYDGKEKRLIESLNLRGGRRREEGRKLEKGNSTEQQLTWTKYIALELRNKELLKEMEEVQKRCEERVEVERKEIEKKEQVIKHVSRKLYDQIKCYEEKIAKLMNDHAEELKEKNGHIKKLVEEVSTSTIEQKNQVFISKVNEITEENLNLKVQLSEKEKQKNDLETVIKAKEETIKEMTSNKFILQSEVESLKLQIENGSTINFEENLKVQLRTNNEMKKQIDVLNEEVTRLQEELASAREEQQKIYNEVKLKEVKESSFRNRLVTEMGIKLQEKENRIGSLEKKMCTLEEKYKSANRQIREKDDFLKNHLMGRIEENQLKEYVQKVIGDYKQAFRPDEKEKVEELEEKVGKLQAKLSYYENNW